MTIAITPAAAADLDAMVILLDELFSIEQDFSPDHVSQRRGLELLLASPNGQILVARAEGKVIGMATAQLVISTAIGAPSAWVEDVVVAQPWRSRGVGAQLLDALADWAAARGAGRLQLLADADNAPALAFYQRLNWTPTRLFAWKKLLR